MLKYITESKKIRILVTALVICALFTAALPSAQAGSDFKTVKESLVCVRNSPSVDGEILDYLEEGVVVRILWNEGNWFRISFGSTVGYIRGDMLSSDVSTIGDSGSGSGSAIEYPEDEARGDATMVLQKGDKSEQVMKMQKALSNKGSYFAAADGEFGEKTETALKDFQLHNNLTVDGVAGPATLAVLYGYADDDSGGNAIVSGNTSIVLKYEDENAEVANLQKGLRYKGYYEGPITGYFGDLTKDAVRMYQTCNGVKVDGVAGPVTLKGIYGNGVSYGNYVEDNGTPVVPGDYSSVQMIDWFASNTIQKAIPRETGTAKVIDTRSGRSFNVTRRGGTNHIDAEPTTRADTNTMKEIRGYWSWDRRPCLVIVGNLVIAASWNGMPHGGCMINDNGFSGHFCIHFKNSRTHASNSVDAAHQACVREAYNWAKNH